MNQGPKQGLFQKGENCEQFTVSFGGYRPWCLLFKAKECGPHSISSAVSFLKFYQIGESMELNTLAQIDAHNVLPRTRLVEICQSMIRKDLEIFHIRDHMAGIFGEIDFYSRHDDELSSIKFVLELAFGKRVDELDARTVAIVDEIVLNAAFHYRRGKIQVDSNEYYSLTAKKITEMIFTAAFEHHPSFGAVKCIQLCFKNFPDLEIPFVKDLSDQMLHLLKENHDTSSFTGDGISCGGG